MEAVALSRATTARSLAVDVATLLAWGAGGVVLAGAWLLVRSAWGAADLREADAQVAAAIVLAALPAWLAWYGSSIESGRSLGQRRGRLAVVGTRRRRWIRFAIHPLAVPAWTWLALLAAAAGVSLLALPVAIVILAILLASALSLVRWMARPDLPAVHDQVAGTRLVRVEGAER